MTRYRRTPLPSIASGLRPGSASAPSSTAPRPATSGARAAADDLYLYGGGLTPELAELIKQAFRGMHLLAYLKYEELDGSDRKDLFDRAAADARTAQDETLGAGEPNAATLDTPSKTSFGVADT